MSLTQVDRRRLLVGAGALGAAAALATPASAKGSVTAAIYPGTWDEAFRSIIAPALKQTKDIDLALEPLFAVDQIAKAQAARGAPPFDAFVLDPGPRATAIDRGLFAPFDAARLANGGKVPVGYADAYGIAVNAQIVGIAYNPKKLPRPKSWKDLFGEPYVSRLRLTGLQTTFGTVSLIEIARAYGGSDTDVVPAFVEIKKSLPKVAAVMAPAALPALFQQGQIDICYTNTNNVASLMSRGVDIDFAAPEEGAITFITTLHIAKGAENIDNAYAYIDAALSTEVHRELSGPAVQRLLLLVIVMPLLTSVVVRTFAWIVILGREGVINHTLMALGLSAAPLPLLQTKFGLALALTQIEMPLMLLPLLTVMRSIDDNVLDASRALGASRWRTLVRVIIPLSLPGWVAGASLVFASSVTAFISQSVIGGGRLVFLPSVIWQQSMVLYDWPFAAVAAVTLLVSVLLIIGLIAALAQRVSRW